MAHRVDDYYTLLKAAIAEAKGAGLEAAAATLESQAFGVYTTSSELIGEHRLAIAEFLQSTGATVPAGVKAKLQQCLKQLGKS